MEGQITIRVMPLYCINERGCGQLGVTLTSLGEMRRRH